MSEGDASSSRGGFPTTHWSLVGRASAHASPAAVRTALAELIRAYLPALRAHLSHGLGLKSQVCDDLLQGFLADKVLEQNVLAAADPQRGKFRTFLLTSLERYVIDVHRAETAAKRSPRGKLQEIDSAAEKIASRSIPSSAFDRAWAGEVLGEVMRRMREECRSTDRLHLWGIFESRMILPILDGISVVSHDVLADKFGLESAVQSANALTSAKRLFTRNFRVVVGEYARDESEVDDEIRDLWDIFSRPRA